MDTDTQQVTVYLVSTQAVAQCPLCHRPSHRIHSHYERTLKDLPVAQLSLTIVLTVCKVFCLNDTCPRRIFTERLPEIVAPWARRTVRYANHLNAIALALGGAAGTRLSEQVGYGHSRNSMLRVIASLPLPPLTTPKILGVDDFALRKGHNYGTILVDLEQHQPIALLPDCTAETLETWLKEHPGVEILSRDRSKTYKRGMSQGAPEAIQVADRFHLLHNLEATLETAFKGHYSVLQQVEKDQSQADGLDVPHPLDLSEDPQSPKALNRAHRLETYEQTLLYGSKDTPLKTSLIISVLANGRSTSIWPLQPFLNDNPLSINKEVGWRPINPISRINGAGGSTRAKPSCTRSNNRATREVTRPWPAILISCVNYRLRAYLAQTLLTICRAGVRLLPVQPLLNSP